VAADGASLGTFAFRKAVRHLSCFQRDGVAFWVDVVAYSTAVAYVVMIPLFLVPGMQPDAAFTIERFIQFLSGSSRFPSPS
jgi:hypothetical protein